MAVPWSRDARATAPAARSARAPARRSPNVSAQVSASVAARPASSSRPSASQHRVRSSRKCVLQALGTSGRLLPSGRTDDGLHGALGIALLDEHGGQGVTGRSRDQTRLQPGRQLDALLRRGQRELEVTRRERGERLVEQVPCEALGIAREPRALDGPVQQVAAFGQLATPPAHPREAVDEDRHEIALSGRLPDRHRSLGVGCRVREAFEVELCGGEIDGCVQPKREVLVGERIDEGRGLGPMGLRIGHRPAECARLGDRGERGRGQRRSSSGAGSARARARPSRASASYSIR